MFQAETRHQVHFRRLWDDRCCVEDDINKPKETFRTLEEPTVDPRAHPAVLSMLRPFQGCEFVRPQHDSNVPLFGEKSVCRGGGGGRRATTIKKIISRRKLFLLACSRSTMAT